MRLSDGPARFHRSPAPLLGEHNHEILRELGLDAAEIAELEAEGIIGRAEDSARHATREVARGGRDQGAMEPDGRRGAGR